jgi:hypothetical protein
MTQGGRNQMRRENLRRSVRPAGNDLLQHHVIAPAAHQRHGCSSANGSQIGTVGLPLG